MCVCASELTVGHAGEGACKGPSVTNAVSHLYNRIIFNYLSKHYTNSHSYYIPYVFPVLEDCVHDTDNIIRISFMKHTYM